MSDEPIPGEEELTEEQVRRIEDEIDKARQYERALPMLISHRDSNIGLLKSILDFLKTAQYEDEVLSRSQDVDLKDRLRLLAFDLCDFLKETIQEP